jgi:two-component system phosphate regulon sensor histidine kinase PhoR
MARAQVSPRFAVAVVLAADRSLLVPAPLEAPTAAASSPSQRCREQAALLAAPPPHDDAGIAAARRDLLAACPEVRSPWGRYVWPILALDETSGASVSGDDVASWIEAHAARLSEPERLATQRDVERSLKGRALERATSALGRSWSRRDALVAALTSSGATAALRAPPTRRGVTTWRADASAGALRLLDDGRLAAFVIDATSLADALAARAFTIPPGLHATVTRGARPRPDDSEGALVADAAVAPELAIRLSPSDPGAAARHATRSRRILGALGAVGVFAAFGLAALLFARMRAARRSSALRTDFVAAVSHELRTPIASMRMLAELLEEDRVEPAEQREVFVALAREARRLGETVDRLLGFSRMAAGRYVIERVSANVASVVAASVDTFEERHPDLPPVQRDLSDVVAEVDAGQVRLAVDNLLANAKKYAPTGTPYVVVVRREGVGVAITVADQGPGIARRDRKRIFEPFERADDRLSRATEGSGIGLSLVQHVAEAHGGRASVASEPGRGAAFTLWLPCNDGRAL